MWWCGCNDHGLLAADHLAAAQLGQDRTGVETVSGRSLHSVAEEARIDPGIAERERFAVDAHRAVLQRPGEILRCVHQLHHIAAVIPALATYRGNEHLERRVARARARRAEERRAGNRCVSPWKYHWTAEPKHQKKTNQKK